MKKLITLTLAAGIAVSVFAAKKPAKPTVAKIDAKESNIKWTGKKVSGSHWGYVQYSEGFFAVDGNNITGGAFNIDMATIENKDLTGEWKAKLEGHLKANDFFGVEKFKFVTVKIKTIQPTKDATGKFTHDVTADVTIKGITKTLTFPAQVIVNSQQVIANADITFDRTQFDVMYKGMADDLIEHDITLNVRAVAKR